MEKREKKKASYVIQGSQGYKQKRTIKQKRSSEFILTHCKYTTVNDKENCFYNEIYNELK